MLGKLFTTPRGTLALNTLTILIGIGLVIAVDDPFTGTKIFLAVTALESAVFSLMYGLCSQWRRQPAARAVFWAVLAYCAVSTHFLIVNVWTALYWQTENMRELMYLAMAVALLNLVLTLVRVLRQGPPVSA